MNLAERAAFERAVMHMTNPTAPLPDFSGFHPAFLSQGDPPTPEGDVRKGLLPVLRPHHVRSICRRRGGRGKDGWR